MDKQITAKMDEETKRIAELALNAMTRAAQKVHAREAEEAEKASKSAKRIKAS